jgi:YHS domain-containing protein
MHMGSHDHAAMTMAIPAGAVDLHNTVCVVTGEKIEDSKLFDVYKGKVYHFCCGDCLPEFRKDPAKYALLVAADPAKYGVKKELLP